MAQRQLTVNVERYHPEQGAAAYVDSYQVPARDGMMVLDALNYIRDDLDPTLAFRWSCRMGICGSLRHDRRRPPTPHLRRQPG